MELGAPPHGGMGAGLERIVMLYYGFRIPSGAVPWHRWVQSWIEEDVVRCQFTEAIELRAFVVVPPPSMLYHVYSPEHEGHEEDLTFSLPLPGFGFKA
ncbi:hypothetical protein ACSSS7_004680 [Eimeria intestinalis]